MSVRQRAMKLPDVCLNPAHSCRLAMRPSRSVRMRRRTLTAVLALTLACSDYDNGPNPPADPGSIQIAASGSVTIAPAQNGSVTVTLTRAGGFTGDVTLTVSGLPAGITATVTPPQLSGVTTTATINLAVGAAVAPGAHAVTVTATGQGITQANATFQITVPPAPSFTVSVPSTGFTIPTSGAGTLDVTLQRTNFTGAIDLSLLNPPAGVTATFTPQSTTGNSAVMTVLVNPTATPGVIPLIMRARAQGLTDRTVQFDLTIRAPAAGNRVEYQFCDPASAPMFFAFQDGTGAWQVVPPVTQGSSVRYAFDITAGYGGAAMVFVTPVSTNVARNTLSLRRPLARTGLQATARRARVDMYETIVIYATTPQLVEDGIETCVATQPTRTATVVASGVPVGSYGFLSFGNTTQIYNPADNASGAISFEGVKTGINDFLGARTTPQNTPDRIILIRDLNIPDGGALPPMNFNTTPALTPATAQVTVTGSSNDRLETYVDLVTANNYQGLWSELASSPATVRPWTGLRQQDMMSTDFHGLIVFASAQDESGDFRVTQRFVDYVTNQTLAMGPVLSLPGITQIPASTRLRFQGMLPGEYDRGIGITVADTSGTGDLFYVTATTGYLAAVGSAFTYDLTMPDFAALTGFPIAALLGPGLYDVAVDGFGFNGPGVFNPPPLRGGEFRAAMRNTTVIIN